MESITGIKVVEFLILIFIFVLIIMFLFSLILSDLNFGVYDISYVESLKACVNSHDFNSTACLYHKPF